MSDEDSHLPVPGGDRGDVRAAMLRAHTSVALVLSAVLALALAAVFAALRAGVNLRRAEAAEGQAQERLLNAYTAQARAIRIAGEPNARQTALVAISNAAAIGRTAELRTEAIACFALDDLVQDGPLIPSSRQLDRVLMDSGLRYYACSGTNNTVDLFSLRDGRLIESLAAPPSVRNVRSEVILLSFSPDGQWLAGRFAGGGVMVWNLATKQAVFARGFNATNPPPPGTVIRVLTELSFSADSRKVIFNDGEKGGQISIYDFITGERLGSAIGAWGKVFRMRPDLQAVAVADSNQVEVLDYPGGTRRATLAHDGRVTLMDWSPDGGNLAVSCADGSIYIWDVEQNTHRRLLGHTERSARMDFSPDGKLFLASSPDGTTCLWDIEQGRLLATANGMAHTFSVDGARIGFWRAWDGFGAWRVLQNDVYSALLCDRAAGRLLTIDLSTRGRWCAAMQERGLGVWDLASNCQILKLRRPEIYCARFSADERTLYVGGKNGLEAWPLDEPLPPKSPRKIALPDERGVRGLALSEDGRWAAVELTDSRLIELDLRAQTPPVVFNGRFRSISFKGPASPTGAGNFAISPDGRWVATGFSFVANEPLVWDGRTGELAARLKADTSVVTFSSDGRWLGLAGMDRYSVWSVGQWKLVKSFARDEATLTHGALAFAPEASLLATARTRQSVQLREADSDEPFADLIPPTPQSIDTIRLALDGSTLITSTPSDVIEVWHLKSLRRQLAAMNLDWGTPRKTLVVEPLAWGPLPTVALSLGAFALVAGLSIVTLRRYRIAMERFIAAEAQGAQRERQLTQARIELLHSQKMQALGTLAVGIAHDFNNLLSVVRMSSKLIGRQPGASAEIQEHVADIEQAVLQGKQVVGSMLGYARNRQDSTDPTDAGLVVAEAVSLLSREFLSGIALTLELERNAPKVSIARGPLEQILLNLVVNASEAMQGTGKLKIVLRECSAAATEDFVLRPGRAGRRVELLVCDSGPGIAPEIRDRIFEPFFTTKSARTKAGTGLGLSLVYTIASENDLGLAVESEPGKGAIFRVVLAAAAAPVRQTHSSQSRPPV